MLTDVVRSHSCSGQELATMNGSLGHKLRSSEDRFRIKEIDLKNVLDACELIPQAVIKQSLEKLVGEQGFTLHKGVDGLDEYQGIALSLEDAAPFAIMRYKGHPEDTFTIYLPRDVRELDEITKRVSKIIHLLGVPDESIEWQRKDDPDY